MLSEKLKMAKSKKGAMKQQKIVLKLMETYKRNGMLSKEKYDQYKAMIEEDVNKIKDIEKGDGANENKN